MTSNDPNLDYRHIVEGRPDLVAPYDYGVTLATKHPPYVYSTFHSACLVHQVLRVELRWWQADGRERLGRRRQPRALAYTRCGLFFRLQDWSAWGHRGKRPAKFCTIPKLGAVHCKACAGHGPTFRRNTRASWNEHYQAQRREAAKALGCEEDE